MKSEKRTTPPTAEKRLAEALRVAQSKRDRTRLRHYLRGAEPVGHHEAELSLSV